jgi:parallel beta-helix repeat protein
MRYYLFILPIVVFLLSATPLHTHIIYVPGDSTTIQGGINGAEAGDTVLVAPGRYLENIDFLGKVVTVLSAEGPDYTIIDGHQSGSVVTFTNGEGIDSKIIGFTLTNGNTSLGGGIYCEGAGPTISDNYIIDNGADIGGGGIMCLYSSSPFILNNLITGNVVSNNGGGIYCNGSSAPTIKNCTIADNCSDYGGGISSRSGSNAIVINSIVWDNLYEGIRGNAQVTYSNVQGGRPGVGNIEEDPLFTDPDGGHYYLQQDPCQPGVENPCVDAGDPGSIMIIGTTRTDGFQDSSIIDMGYHYPVKGEENYPPVARLHYSPLYPEPDDTIMFDASDSYDRYGTIVLYEWDWESDGIYDDSNVIPTITHFWTIPDSYLVTLRVTDDEGASDTESIIVDVFYYHSIFVPDDYLTIQDAIDASRPGDSVVIRPGTYIENIDFRGKAIVVRSENGPDATIIDGRNPANPDSGSAVYFTSGEDSSSILDGFTIMNGSGTYLDYRFGGGIYCIDSHPKIVNNIIENNSTNGHGGGIYCRYSDALIVNNVIKENSAPGGGGIFSFENSPTISNNVITDNYSVNDGGGICLKNSFSHIINNFISNNEAMYGGGIRLSDSYSTIANNEIIANTATNQGGGIFCNDSSPLILNNIIAMNRTWPLSEGGGIYLWDESYPTITNNTIALNSGLDGGGIYSNEGSIEIINTILWANSGAGGSEIYVVNGELTVTYSNIQGGWPGEGNIDVNPMFVSFRGFDYLLHPSSLCIDSGDPTIEDGFQWPWWYSNDLRSDMGAYGGPGNIDWLP